MATGAVADPSRLAVKNGERLRMTGELAVPDPDSHDTLAQKTGNRGRE
jgi:hypothetical protein